MQKGGAQGDGAADVVRYEGGEREGEVCEEGGEDEGLRGDGGVCLD